VKIKYKRRPGLIKEMNILSLIFIGITMVSGCLSDSFDNDDTNQTGLWSSEAELSQIPMSGPAWEEVQAAADIDFSEPVIANNNSNDDVNCLAAAIVYARTGNLLYKDRVIAAPEYNIARGNPGFDSNLSLQDTLQPHLQLQFQ
jgi:hypothetical protein